MWQNTANKSLEALEAATEDVLNRNLISVIALRQQMPLESFLYVFITDIQNQLFEPVKTNENSLLNKND